MLNSDNSVIIGGHLSFRNSEERKLLFKSISFRKELWITSIELYKQKHKLLLSKPYSHTRLLISHQVPFSVTMRHWMSCLLSFFMELKHIFVFDIKNCHYFNIQRPRRSDRVWPGLISIAYIEPRPGILQKNSLVRFSPHHCLVYPSSPVTLQ